MLPAEEDPEVVSRKTTDFIVSRPVLGTGVRVENDLESPSSQAVFAGLLRHGNGKTVSFDEEEIVGILLPTVNLCISCSPTN